MILQLVIMMISLQEKAAVDNAEPYDGADYQESVQLDDEGAMK